MSGAQFETTADYDRDEAKAARAASPWGSRRIGTAVVDERDLPDEDEL